MTRDEVVAKMDELTPSNFKIKGGKYADYAIAMKGGKLYSQAVARILHANDEHAAQGGTYDVKILPIFETTQLIEGKPIPVLIITVEINSTLFGTRMNSMTAIMDTQESENPISASHPVEKAVTQAIGRCLGLYGFAFTGNLASEEEIYEGEGRQKMIEKASSEEKHDPINMLKDACKGKGVDYNQFLVDSGVTEEELQTVGNRSKVFQLLNNIRKS